MRILGVNEISDLVLSADSILARQVKVSRLSSLGFVLSIVGLAGIGSLIALILGLWALKVIRQANGGVSGKWLAIWCIVAGSIGSVVYPYLIISRLLKS